MNKSKYILIFLLASVTMLFGVVLLIYLFVWNNNNNLQGTLVFSETYNKGNLVDKIELKSKEDVVTIVYKDNYWVIENKNNYYADFKLLNNLFNSINKSIYSIKFPFDEKVANEKLLNNPVDSEHNTGVLIKIFAENKKIEEVIVGVSDETKNYSFSRNLRDNNIWLISENFEFPRQAKDWIMHPILNIPEKQIEAIQINDRKIKRIDKHYNFYNEKGEFIDPKVFVNELSGLFAVDVIDETGFSKIDVKEISKKNIKITTFLGLIFDIDVYYSSDEKMWCKIKLSSTSLPMSIVNDYINDNKFLYEGWYFEISPWQRSIIRDFHLL